MNEHYDKIILKCTKSLKWYYQRTYKGKVTYSQLFDKKWEPPAAFLAGDLVWKKVKNE